jgi:hypothetical protein
MQILPQPKEIKEGDGCFTLNRKTAIIFDANYASKDSLLPLQQLADEIMDLFKFRPRLTRAMDKEDNSIYCSFDESLNKDDYKLEIKDNGIAIYAGAQSGLYYGIQTLRQILRSEGIQLSCLTINDVPDFVNRGFYHDATRGKVATLATYKDLVDKLAFYKLNQLQLYVEHSFAFSKHTDIWSCSDPLTHEEILELDIYCLQHHIELIPSLSTLGHFYMPLTSKRKEHLNELDTNGSEKPFSFPDRQHHYTLDCQNPESAVLIDELIAEFAPLFSSNKFNFCFDEPFDLGKGKNKALADEKGVGRLFMDFLTKVIASVRKQGKQPMMWGDIILKYPEYISELPKDIIFLNWEYAESLLAKEALGDLIVLGDSKVFAEAGLEFYNCPGVSCWNRNSSRINGVDRNIQMMAKEGKEDGATGLLNTDWGDYGHFNLLSPSYYGLVLGAAAAWNSEAVQNIVEFEDTFSIIETGDASKTISGLLRKLGDCELFEWYDLVRWVTKIDKDDDLISFVVDDETGMMKRCLELNEDDLYASYIQAKSIEERIREIAVKSKAQDELFYREILFSTWGVALFQSIGLAWKRSLGKKVSENVPSYYEIADELRHFEIELSELWHLRNKPSEYYRIKEHINKVAIKLDELGIND